MTLFWQRTRFVTVAEHYISCRIRVETAHFVISFFDSELGSSDGVLVAIPMHASFLDTTVTADSRLLCFSAKRASLTGFSGTVGPDLLQ